MGSILIAEITPAGHSVDEAIERVKKAASLTRAKVVMYHRPYGYRANAYSAAPPLPTTQINFVNLQLGELGMLRRPQFLYLWSTDLTQDR